MGVFAFLDIAVFALPTGQYYTLDNWRIYQVAGGETLVHTWATGVLSLLVAVASLALIFLFKRRMLQMRLTIFLLLVILGQLGYIAWTSWQFTAQTGASFAVRFPLALPLICLPLLYLAARRMIYDETLVRASNRLR